LVLVVEDDKDMREIVSDSLIGAGYSAITASNGAQGARYLEDRTTPPHSSRFEHAVMDGFEFRRLQRSEPALAQIPTVVMSALPQNRLAELSMGEALEKPLELEQLLRAIEPHWGLRGTRNVPEGSGIKN
jgi:CheY-like chemotaxis protein